MRTALALVLFALPLAGCVSSGAPQGPSPAQVARAECDGRGFRRQLDRANCVNAAERLEPPPAAIVDLVNVKYATRVALAEKVDRGQMTKAEAALEFSSTMSQLWSASEARAATAQGLAIQAAQVDAIDNIGRPRNCIGGPQIRHCF